MASSKENERRELRYVNAKEWAERQNSDFESRSVKLPKGFEWFKFPDKGNYDIDVIPYVAGRYNLGAKEGYITPEATYYVHRGLGLEGKTSYTCPAKTFHERCPICEFLSMHPNLDKDTWKKLAPQKRMLWNFLNVKEEKQKIRVYDSAYRKSFPEVLKELIDTKESWGDYYLLESGRTLSVRVDDEAMPQGKFRTVTTIVMEKRDYQYPEEILDSVCCLDECIIKVTYDDLRKIFLEGGPAIETDDAPSDETRYERRPRERDPEPEPEDKPVRTLPRNGARPAAQDDDRSPNARTPKPKEPDEPPPSSPLPTRKPTRPRS